MSYDLYVLSQHEPTEIQIRMFLSRYPAVSVLGSFSEQNNLVIDAQFSEGWTFTIDPPGTFDAEEAPYDMDDEALQRRLIPQPTWETFISVPYFRAEERLQVAHSLARYLAGENEGKVWDPQTETLADDQPSLGHAIRSSSEVGDYFEHIEKIDRRGD